jgi:hypothetical protein
MCRVVHISKHPDLLTGLTKRVDKGELGFPREVCAELEVIAREEPIWAWANGLTSKLDPFSSNINYIRPLMTLVVRLGFEYGIETLEKDRSAFAPVGRLCLMLQEESTDFVLATEDTGEVPLRPTMEQVAQQAGWQHLDARGALNYLGLADLLG